MLLHPGRYILRAIGFLVCILSFCGCGLRQAEFGNWVVRLPEDSDYFYAVGGPNPDRPAANDNARAEMAKFISVTVDSEIERVTVEQDGEIETTVVDQLRLKAEETLENVSIVEVRKTGEGYYTLARMPSRPIEDILESLRFKKVPPTAGEIARSILLPGWGQFQKDQSRKGFGILSGQALTIGSGALFYVLKSSAEENMIYAKTHGARKAYQQDSQTLKSLMISSLVTAGAVYIYNLVDVTAVPKKVPIDQE